MDYEHDLGLKSCQAGAAEELWTRKLKVLVWEYLNLPLNLGWAEEEVKNGRVLGETCKNWEF